jgi:hypothetical protein
MWGLGHSLAAHAFGSARAFSGKVDTGFPKENATNIESGALFVTGSRSLPVNLNEKRSS